MVIVVVSIVLYIVDVGTDVQLAVRYFQHGERIYGGLTTAFITVAYLVVLVVGFGSYMGNYDVPGYWWACRITFLMLGLSPVVFLAVTAVMFFKRHRIGLGETEKVNFTSQLFYFLWRVCETGGRVLCIALFASTFEYWVFAVLCSHYVIMVVWFIWVNSNRDSWAVLTCFLFGYVLLFYMPFHSRPSRYLHLFYYVIFHAENFLMLGLWAGMTSDRDAWFYIPVIVAVVVFFFLHIVMQVVYYKAFHPKSKDIDWCTTCDWKTVHQSLKNLRS
nr:hypothetical protein BaRGS_021798 [Batillaria attramentaria]